MRREDVQSIAEKSDWFESSDSFNDFMWALYDLPSAQPERKTGKWEKDTKTGRWRCSECYAFALKTDDGRESLSDYCPVCGVKMEKPEDIPMEYFESGGI